MEDRTMNKRSLIFILMLGVSVYAAAAETLGQSRIVHFPEDKSLGRLRIRDRGSQRWQDWKDYGFARGDVVVPDDKELELTVIFEAFENRSCLASLEPDDIQELDICSEEIADADLVYIKGLTGLESLTFGGTCMGPCPLTGQGLVNLKDMTKLRFLMLDCTSLTDDNFVHLKSLKTLEKLWIHRNWQFTGDGLVHLENLPSLRELQLYSTPIGNDALKHVDQIKALEDLSLQSTQVTDEGLVHLKNMSSLKELLIPRQITDDGLVHLKGLTCLEKLIIYSTDITDVGLAHLKNLSSLKLLTLFSPRVTPAAVEQLAKDLPELDINISLRVNDNSEMARIKGLSYVTSLSLVRSKVTDVGFANIEGLTSLTYLNASYTEITDVGFAHLQGLCALNNLDLTDSHITDVGLAHVKGLTSLGTLRLRNTAITDAGLIYLKDLKELEMLFLDNTHISDAGLVHLRALTSLGVLFLSRTNVTGSGLIHLKPIKALRHLDLSGTPLTDEAVEHLKEMTWLRTLALNATEISDEALQRLRQALPDCTLHFSKEPSAHETKSLKSTSGRLMVSKSMN
jgi:F-box/leucine-rich repeat protein 14